MWTHCAYGQAWDVAQCSGDPLFLSWDDAFDYVEGLNNTAYAGYNDWRLPTTNELLTLMDRRRVLPSTTFPGMGNGFYWASTASAQDIQKAWDVCFWFGNTHADIDKDADNLQFARAVRGGMCLADGEWCIDSNDCFDDDVCVNGACVENACSLSIRHGKIRADKLSKPLNRTFHITGGEGFSVDGEIDNGPFILREGPIKNMKKNKLKLKVIVPQDLKPGTVQIRVGNCFGVVEIQ
jgi:hypothetical protein